VPGFGHRVPDSGYGAHYSDGLLISCHSGSVGSFALQNLKHAQHGEVLGFGYRVSGFGYRGSGMEFRVSSFGYGLSGFGFLVWGFGFRNPMPILNLGMTGRPESPYPEYSLPLEPFPPRDGPVQDPVLL
jgi:hypothetical protein